VSQPDRGPGRRGARERVALRAPVPPAAEAVTQLGDRPGAGPGPGTRPPSVRRAAAGGPGRRDRHHRPLRPLHLRHPAGAWTPDRSGGAAARSVRWPRRGPRGSSRRRLDRALDGHTRGGDGV